MIVKTIRDYTDRETKVIYRVGDKNPTREVTDERGAELIAKGVAIEVENKKKAKKLDKTEVNEEVKEENNEEVNNEGVADENVNDENK